MSSSSLDRFVEAQAGGEYETALGEITSGRKRSHWIRYIFPQISGLGLSHMSQLYAIRDRDEAVAYLHHPVLSPLRLLGITHRGLPNTSGRVRRSNRLMGLSIDATKLVSSLTLFSEVARKPEQTRPTDASAVLADLAEEVLIAAAAQGYHRCHHTLGTSRARVEKVSDLAPSEDHGALQKANSDARLRHRQVAVQLAASYTTTTSSA